MILILGKARTGTSLVGNVLRSLGYDTGEHDAPNHWNPNGNFSDVEFQQVHRSLYSGSPIRFTIVDSPAWARWHALIDQHIPGDKWAIKDHGMLPVLNQFADYLAGKGEPLRVIHCLRDERDSLASFRARRLESGGRTADVEQYQEACNTLILAFLEKYKPETLHLNFEQSLEYPAGYVKAVADFCGVAASPEAIACIDASLHRFTGKGEAETPKPVSAPATIGKRNFCYWTCDTTTDGADRIAAMIASARACGVKEDFHAFANVPVVGAISHQVGPIDIKYHIFKWTLLRDHLASLDYEYFVWLDSDNYFVRHPGNLSNLLRDNAMWCQLESETTSPNVRQAEWWGLPVADYNKMLADHGVVGESKYNTNGGMWIVRKSAVESFVRNALEFHAMCLARGLDKTHDETPLAWIGQLKHLDGGDWVRDPELNTSAATKDTWGCDWMGRYLGKLPDGVSWMMEDYMTGEKRLGSPAIVHAMRSKIAMSNFGKGLSNDTAKVNRADGGSDQSGPVHGGDLASQKRQNSSGQNDVGLPERGSGESNGNAAGQSANSNGVGDNLHEILLDCGIKPCPIECEEWRRKMNAWGIAGCNENRQAIINRLNDQALRGNWWTIFSNASKVALRGYTSSESLLDEAIKRAGQNPATV